MAQKSAVLAVRIISDARNAVAGFQKTSGAARAMSAGVEIAKRAMVAAGAGVVAYGAYAIKAASDLEQSGGAIEAVFKGHAGEMQKMANSASTNLGLTRNEFNELGTVIGAQLKNGGTAMDELAPKTQQLIATGADLSAQFGGTTQEAVESLSAALRGERDPIEKYGVSLTQAAVDAKAAELGFKKVGGSLSTEANQAATLALITQQTADAHGAFARESDTVAHQVQVAKAQWGDLAATLGAYLLPVISQVGKWLNETLMPAVANMAAQVPAAIDAVRAKIAEINGWYQAHADIINSVATVIGILLIPAFIRLGVAATAAAASQVAAWVLSAAQAVAAGIAYAAASWGIVANWVAMGGAAVASGLETAAVWALYVADAVSAGIAYAAVAAQIVAGWVAQGAAAVASGIRTAAAFAGLVAGWVMMGVQAAASAAVVVAGWVMMGVQALAQAARMAAAWFIALGPIGWVTAAVIAIVALIIANWDKVSSWTARIWGNVARWVSDAWNNVVDGTKNAISAVVGYFHDLPGHIWNQVSGLYDDMMTLGHNLLVGLMNGVSNMAQNAYDFVRRIGGNVLNAIKNSLGIHSPSKYTTEYGKFLGQGLINGIDAMGSRVTDAARDMLAIPTNEAAGLTVPVALSARSAGPSGAVSGAPGGSVAPQISITVNGPVDKLSAAREIRELLARLDWLEGVKTA